MTAVARTCLLCAPRFEACRGQFDTVLGWYSSLSTELVMYRSALDSRVQICRKSCTECFGSVQLPLAYLIDLGL